MARDLLNSARRALSMGKPREAIGQLHEALRLTASRRLVPQIIIELIGAHAATEDLTGCWYYTKLFYQTLTYEQQQPFLATAVAHVGEAYEVMGRWSEAAEAYRQALWVTSSQAPDFPKEKVMLRLAGCLTRSNHQQEAAEILGALADSHLAAISTADVAVEQALLAMVQGDAKKAYRLAKQVLDTPGAGSKARCQACTVLADLAQDRGEWVAARQWLEEASVHAAVAESDRLTEEILRRLEVLSEEEALQSREPGQGLASTSNPAQ
jgi:tetratricopeptide (TPR) repeat protein